MKIGSFNVSRHALFCLLLGIGASTCKRDNGSSSPFAQNVRLPSDWPSQVPAYPGGTIVTGTKLTFGDTLVQRTGDAPAMVLAFYEAQLRGMHVINSVDNGVVQSRTWSNDEEPLQVTLQLGRGDGDKTTFATLQVTHVPKAVPGAPTSAGQTGDTAH
jgi:hypothetical protein